jgi:tRNA dimethylallyltransferase
VTASKTPQRRIIVIAGATAVGKTELATPLCEEIGGEVVSADSRQVYRRLEVGTAKPSAEIRARVAHHLIDIVDPDEDCDASIWRAHALTAIADIDARGKTAVVCGGTGLYIRSLTQGLFPGPAADQALRARFAEEEKRAPGALFARLAVVDPEAAKRIHANDMVRIVRALEVEELSGKPISVWQQEHALAESPFDVLTLEVSMPREDLYARIDQRSQEMVDGGLLEELAGLRGEGYAPGLTAFDAIGYREAGLCLDGELPRSELVASVAQATRNYAKRQLIWIRGQMDATPIENVAAALARAQEFLHASESPESA